MSSCQKCGEQDEAVLELKFDVLFRNGDRVPVDLDDPLCQDCIRLVFAEAEAV